MVETIHIFFADEYIGDLIHDTLGDKYKFIKKSNSPMANEWVRITNADKGDDRFKETITDTRCMSPDRIDCREILKRLGLLEFNAWEIMKKINFTSEDLFWGSKEMNPKWFWENHYLASYHPNYTRVTGKQMFSQVIPVDEFSIY